MTAVTNQKQNAIDWEYHINHYLHSGQTKATYCESQGLRVKQFEYYYRCWKEKARKDKIFATHVPQSEFSPIVVKPSATVSNRAKTPEGFAKSSGIELQLANGIRCKVDADFCKVTLKQVMELSL